MIQAQYNFWKERIRETLKQCGNSRRNYHFNPKARQTEHTEAESPNPTATLYFNLLFLKSLLFLINKKRISIWPSPSGFWMPKGPESFNDGDANESVHPCVALSRLTALCGHRLINLYCIPLGEGEKLKVIKHCKKSHPPWKLTEISLIGMQSEHRAFHRCAREKQEAARPFRSAKHRRRLLKPPDLVGSNYLSSESGGGPRWGFPGVPGLHIDGPHSWGAKQLGNCVTVLCLDPENYVAFFLPPAPADTGRQSFTESQPNLSEVGMF